jgi:hypothetical protein
MKRFICCLPNKSGGGPINEMFYPDTPEGHVQAEAFARRFDRPGFAIYDAVNVYQDNAATRNLETVAALTVIHVDVDAKDVEEGKGAIWQRIQELPYTPDVVNDSGHGYHVYYYLKEPVLVESEEAEAMRKVRSLLVEFLCGDPHCNHDCALMRRVNTTNSKDKANPVLCTRVMGEAHAV